ncbi:hypothetical protein GCM10025789_29240 [Tessaracoccus lubricantis]|uniref:Glycosyl transferase family 1 domain-containing protein n=1 Tax=Tessaracoccus lubricantis TaxID=545543 RepID=A0ABP9FQA3_9ACTN
MTDATAILPDADFVLLTPSYPKPWRPGREFVRTRARAYAAAGLGVAVVETSLRAGAGPEQGADGDIPVLAIAPEWLPGVLDVAADAGLPVLAHSPEPTTIDALLDRVPTNRLAVWFHGYEVRDYRRLAGNHDSRELASIRTSRDELNRARFEAAGRLFDDDAATVVFVSQFQRDLAAQDVGVAARNARVIPNHIDGDTFLARVRGPEEATRLLLLRSFSERNYGNDIALRALELLAGEPGFDELTVTIRGFGRHFATETASLRGLRNVVIEERYSSPIEMAAAHHRHGVFLCPTRFDTQGVMLGEAMASGMVTVTNPVAAIPEFTDESCSLLPRAEDPWAFAGAIRHLLEHRDLMPGLSAAAAERVREQCGRAATIDLEIDLIGGLAA